MNKESGIKNHVQPSSYNSYRSGFSLLEVLVAMTIVSIAAVSFGSLMISSVKGVTQLDKYVVANFLAINEIENVRQTRDSSYIFYLKNPNDVASSTYKHPLNFIVNLTRPSENLNGVIYTVNRTATCIAQDSSNNCLKLKLVVSVTADGKNAISVTEYLYDYLPPVESF